MTVVCWDFASAISVLTDSSSSTTAGGEASDELGPAAADEEERKMVETRFMRMIWEGMGVGGIPKRGLAPCHGPL